MVTIHCYSYTCSYTIVRQLTDAINSQIGKTFCHGFLFEGERYDCGSKLGFIQANITFALERNELKNELSTWLKKI